MTLHTNKIVLDLTDTELETLVKQVGRDDSSFTNRQGSFMSYDAKQVKKKVEKAVKEINERTELERRLTVAIKEAFSAAKDLEAINRNDSEEHY